MSTPDFGIPTLQQQQVTPEATINEALFALQLKSGIGVIGVLNTPPASPVEGDSYIVGTSPTGLWAGRANCIVGRLSGSWVFVPGNDSSGTPITMGTRHKGLSAYRMDTSVLVRWNGTAWA